MTLEEAYAVVDADPNSKRLRRVPPVESWTFAQPTGDTVRACIVDCETTGIGDDDECVELGILPFDYDKATGRLTAVHKPFNAFCQPSKPIPTEATAIHGITNEMVAGRFISEEDVAAVVGGAKLLIAHQATFDRRMTAAKWPLLDTIPWGCSWSDVDWRSGGFESGKLAYLLMCQGHFYDGHRAGDDCIATLFALKQLLGGHPALFALLQRLREHLYKVTLRNTPYSCKDAIKARGGYAWDDKHPAGKNWWKVVPASELDAETVWASTFCKPEAVKVPAVARHSNKVAEL